MIEKLATIKFLHALKSETINGVHRFIYVMEAVFVGSESSTPYLVFSRWDDFKKYTNIAADLHDSFVRNNVNHLLVAIPDGASQSVLRGNLEISNLGRNNHMELVKGYGSLFNIIKSSEKVGPKILDRFVNSLEFIGLSALDKSSLDVISAGNLGQVVGESRFLSETIPEIFVELMYLLGFSALIGKNLCSYDLDHLFFTANQSQINSILVPGEYLKETSDPVTFELFESLVEAIPFVAPETLIYNIYNNESEVFCACSVIAEMIYRGTSPIRSRTGWYNQYQMPEEFFLDLVKIILRGREYERVWTASRNDSSEKNKEHEWKSWICDPRIQEYKLRMIARYLFNLGMLFGGARVDEIDPLYLLLDGVSIIDDNTDTIRTDTGTLAPNKMVGNEISDLLSVYYESATIQVGGKPHAPLVFLHGIAPNLENNLLFGLVLDPFKRLEPVSLLMSQSDSVSSTVSKLRLPKFLLGNEKNTTTGKLTNTVSLENGDLFGMDNPAALKIFHCLVNSNENCRRKYEETAVNMHLDQVLEKYLGKYSSLIPKSVIHSTISKENSTDVLLTPHTLEAVYGCVKKKNT